LQNECWKKAKLESNALADYVAKGSKTALPPFPFSYRKAMCGPTVTRVMQEITTHVGRLFKTLISAYLCAPECQTAAEWMISDSFAQDSKALKQWILVRADVMELNDDTHFAIILALSKFMALYKDDNTKARIEEDMQLLTYDPAANISTNELTFTVIFARSDAVALETQHLDEENCPREDP